MTSINYQKGWLAGFEARSLDIKLAISEVMGLVESEDLPVKDYDAKMVLDKLNELLNSNID